MITLALLLATIVVEAVGLTLIVVGRRRTKREIARMRSQRATKLTIDEMNARTAREAIIHQEGWDRITGIPIDDYVKADSPEKLRALFERVTQEEELRLVKAKSEAGEPLTTREMQLLIKEKMNQLPTWATDGEIRSVKQLHDILAEATTEVPVLDSGKPRPPVTPKIRPDVDPLMQFIKSDDRRIAAARAVLPLGIKADPWESWCAAHNHPHFLDGCMCGKYPKGVS